MIAIPMSPTAILGSGWEEGEGQDSETPIAPITWNMMPLRKMTLPQSGEITMSSKKRSQSPRMASRAAARRPSPPSRAG